MSCWHVVCEENMFCHCNNEQNPEKPWKTHSHLIVLGQITRAFILMGLRRLVPTSEPRTIEDLRLLQAVGRGVFRRRVDPEEALQVGMFYFFIWKPHDRYILSFQLKQTWILMNQMNFHFLMILWGVFMFAGISSKKPPKSLNKITQPNLLSTGLSNLRPWQREVIGLGDMGSSSRSCWWFSCCAKKRGVFFRKIDWTLQKYHPCMVYLPTFGWFLL